jgi:hypothetical protein
MNPRTVILDTPDATLRRYTKEFDRLTLDFQLWDETIKCLTVEGVVRLEDDGTWEAEALVRLPEFDVPGKLGYGILSVEGAVTLRIVADEFKV